jgi:hypothetical protein
LGIVLWVIAGALAALFLVAGTMKIVTPAEKLKTRMSWIAAFPAGWDYVIGVAEVLGAIGLILPGATGVATVLTPIAAVALGATMLGATIYHVVAKEFKDLPTTIVLTALCVFVAWGRFGPCAF